jgi:hypothetical protein
MTPKIRETFVRIMIFAIRALRDVEIFSNEVAREPPWSFLVELDRGRY